MQDSSGKRERGRGAAGAALVIKGGGGAYILDTCIKYWLVISSSAGANLGWSPSSSLVLPFLATLAGESPFASLARMSCK